MDVDEDKAGDEEREGDETAKVDEQNEDEAMLELTSDGMALDTQALDQLQAKAQQEFTVDDLNTMREELDTMIGKWREDAASAQLGMEIWKKMSATTAPLAAELCEQLRLILEPTLKSKLQGDYRSGKRLNMRKVIPYIASNFRKDKIWLRRTKPNTRNYQVMITVDDSESVAHGVSTESSRLPLECALMSDARALVLCSEKQLP
jgi:midasin